MKILRISGCNLASLAGEFVLDFEHGPLADTHLYAISGPTGAGKSTLLDALSLALYDRTPRLETNSGYQIADVAEAALGVHDPRTLLRRGTAEGWAEVWFVGSDQRRYRARWSVRRARKLAHGRLQASELSLHDDHNGVPLGRTKLEVLAAIERVVGLSFDQFRRSVLLAQGDFAAFLKARSDERSDLLERMTGTALYSRVSQRAHLKARQIETDLRAQEAAAQALPVLDAAARAALEAQIAERGAAVDQCARELETCRAGQLWWTRLAELQHKHDSALARLADCDAAWQAAASRREALAQIEAVAPLRARVLDTTRTTQAQQEAVRQSEATTLALGEAQASDQQASAALQQATAALQQARHEAERVRPEIERAKALDHTLADQGRALQVLEREGAEATDRLHTLQQTGQRLQATRVQLQQQLDMLQEWMRTHATAVALVPAWNDGIAPQLRRYAELHVRWHTRHTEGPALQQAYQQAQRALAQARIDGATYEAAAHTTRALMQQAEAAEAEVPQAALAARRAALEQGRGALNALQQQHEHALRIAQACVETETELAQTHAAQANAITQATTAAAELQRLTEDLAATTRVLLQLGLQAHRAQLVDGEPCPLCGSTTHPGVGAIDTTLAVLEDQQHQLSARQAELQHTHTAQQTLAQTHAQRAQTLVEQLERLQTQAAQAQSAWQSLGGKGDPLQPEATDELHRRAQQLQTDAQALSELERNLQRLQAAARQARTDYASATQALEQARKVLHQAEREDHTAQQRLHAAEHELRDLQRDLDEALQALTPAFHAVEGWPQALTTDPTAFLHTWDVWIRTARTQIATQTATQHTLGELDTQVREHAVALRLAEQHHVTLDQRRQQALQQHAEHRVQRDALLQGQSVAQVEAAWHTTLQRHEQSLAQATDHAHHASTAVARTREAHRLAYARLEEAQADQQRAAATLEAALVSAGIDAATLHARLAFDAHWQSVERAALSALEQARASAALAAHEREQDLAAHTAKPAPATALETLSAQLATLEPQHRALAEQFGALSQQRAQDDQHRATGAERASALALAREQAQVWLQLDQLIGSADGRKFRTFAQSLTLERLLAHANAELASLAPRYQLQRVPSQDLELQVIDRDMGDDIRATASLSGGETFLVSLALALGLSALASDQVRIQSLFIDEGFGSLDPQTLESALSTLDALQSAGRKVGLISHVPGLAERIGVQVRVERQGQGASGVRVVVG